jgi:signal transduction histidine kinase
VDGRLTTVSPRSLARVIHGGFSLAILAVVTVAVIADVLGFQQARTAIERQAQYSAQELLRALGAPANAPVVRSLALGHDRGGLRPQFVDVWRWPVEPNVAPPFPVLDDAYFSRFVGPDGAATELAAVVPGNDQNGLRLYVLARFDADRLVPSSPGRVDGDIFKLDVLRAGQVVQRWRLVLRRPLQTNDCQRTPECFLLDWQPLDANGAPLPGAPQKLRREYANGSVVSVRGQPAARSFTARLSLRDVLRPGEDPLDAGLRDLLRNELVLRIEHLYSGPDGSLVQRVATFERDGDRVVDRSPTPRVRPESLYPSPGFGETLTVADPTGATVWACRFPRQGEAIDGPACPPSEARPPVSACTPWAVWRCLLFDVGPLAWPVSEAERERAQIVVAGTTLRLTSLVPAEVALSTWNRFAPRLVSSFAAVIGVLTLLWWYVIDRVLRRVERLAGAAAELQPDTTDQRALPFQQSSDEIGVLSRALHDLVQRVRRDAEQKRQVAQAEQDRLKFIRHQISSAVQALLNDNPPGTENYKYVDRIARTIRALSAADNVRDGLDQLVGVGSRTGLVGFVRDVAENAPQIGIRNVVAAVPDGDEFYVAVDPEALQEALVQLLNNAHSFRRPDTPITLRLSRDGALTTLSVENIGETIDETRLEDIFNMGVSIRRTPHPTNQGQGLFVARQFVSRMNGTIRARNLMDGVAFDVTLPIVT